MKTFIPFFLLLINFFSPLACTEFAGEKQVLDKVILTWDIVFDINPPSIKWIQDAFNKESTIAGYVFTTDLELISELKPFSEKKDLKIADVDLSSKDNSLAAYCKEHFLYGVDFIRIHPESSEIDILDGAIDLINHGEIGCVQFLYNDTYKAQGKSLKDVFDFFSGKPYKIFTLAEGNLTPISAWNVSLPEGIYLAISTHHQEDLNLTKKTPPPENKKTVRGGKRNVSVPKYSPGKKPPGKKRAGAGSKLKRLQQKKR